ncbi:MAG: hypothetical protein LVR00_03095 [Rhabdochlamydiaceae bacterium]|jgi:hypothetical protein
MQKLDPLSKQSATEYSEAAGFSASETAANGALFSRYAFKAALATPLIVGSVAIALGGISTRARLLSIALIVTSLALLIIEKYAPGSIIRENRQAPSKELPLLGASPKITLKSFLPLIKKGENGESYLLESECVGILSYLKAHQDTLIAKAKLENKCVRVKAHDCPDLPRTILVTPEENIFVILNRTESKKDKTVGDGTLKKVKLCFELTQQKMCTHITFKDPNKPHLLDAIFKREQNEISLLSKWKGRPHFLQLLATDTYTSKKQTKKSSIITPYYSSGNLSSVLKTTEFSSDEKKAFFLKAALAVQENAYFRLCPL